MLRLVLALAFVALADTANAQGVKAKELARTTLVTYGGTIGYFTSDPTMPASISVGFFKSNTPTKQEGCFGPVVKGAAPVPANVTTTELAPTEQILGKMFTGPGCTGTAGPLSAFGWCRPDNAACTDSVIVLSN